MIHAFIWNRLIPLRTLIEETISKLLSCSSVFIVKSFLKDRLYYTLEGGNTYQKLMLSRKIHHSSSAIVPFLLNCFVNAKLYCINGYTTTCFIFIIVMTPSSKACFTIRLDTLKDAFRFFPSSSRHISPHAR